LGTIYENLQNVRERIARAAEGAGRTAEDVHLVAISKTFPADAVAEAYAAGQRVFGENRVQEAQAKIPQLAGKGGIQWHLVGHLQSNKVRRAVDLFQAIDSVDGLKLLSRLNEAALEAGKLMPVLVQVDLGHEETKFGADAGQIPEILEKAADAKNIVVDGLMTIPPWFDDSEHSRPFFVRLRNLRDSLESQAPGCLGRRHLSMGMSHDFEIAIQEGATMVRIGTAIFGERSHG
jgi:pyridoxal phosphate enzyme (YggS family)